MSKIKLVEIPCPLCEHIKYDEIYKTKQYAGDILGVMITRLVMCESCGFVFLNPRPSDEDMNRYYMYDRNASGGVYRQMGKDSLYERLINERIEFFKKYLPDRGTLLDVGCGRGDFLKGLKVITELKILGLELSIDCCKSAETEGFTIIKGKLDKDSFHKFF